jgi:polar amino acid transport system substrate-binding protein
MAVAVAAMALVVAGCSEKPAPQTNAKAVAAPAAKTAVAPDAKGGLPAKLVVGLDDNFPPMGFRDEKGQIVGFDIDLARAACKEMGIPVEFKPIDWSAKEAELASHRVDLLWNGLTITADRAKHMAFSRPYMENHQIIVVAAHSKIKNKAGLAGKIVGVQEGSSAVDAIEKEPAVLKSFKSLRKYSDNVKALLDLSLGRLDAVVLDEIVARYYVHKKPGEYVIIEGANQTFGAEQYGVGMRQDDKALLTKVNEALDKLHGNGEEAKISQKWFGADIAK